MAVLQISKGATPGDFPLNGGTVTLGRDKECTVVIRGQMVSRLHARIVQVEGQFYLEDNKSRNGTFVNDEPIDGRVLLRDKDRIKIGDFLATFCDAPAVQAPAAPPALAEEARSPRTRAPGSLEKTMAEAGIQPWLELRARLGALFDITTCLTRTPASDSTLPQILDHLFRLFPSADRDLLIVKDGRTGTLGVRAGRSRRPGEQVTFSFSPVLVAECLQTVQPIRIDDAATDERLSDTDAAAGALLCAPLVGADGTAFGVLQVETQQAKARFNAEDVQFVVAVANELAAALQNARLQEELSRQRRSPEVELTRQMQQSFRCRRPPDVAGYEVSVSSELAPQLGGDFHDFIPLPSGRLAIVLGDVAGRGMAAAVLGTHVESEARYLLRTEADPTTAVGRLNRQMVGVGLGDRCVTLLAAVLELDNRGVTLVSAGGEPPLVYRRARRTVEEALDPVHLGFPLGVLGEHAYESSTIRLDRGDYLLLFTHGVSETLKAQTQPRTLRVILLAAAGTAGSARELGERVIGEFRRQTAGPGPLDDLTLVCIRRTAAS
jgi:serine phosphatase RsbU (regulator of sigma subunit)